jgi:hypothetical protein
MRLHRNARHTTILVVVAVLLTLTAFLAGCGGFTPRGGGGYSPPGDAASHTPISVPSGDSQAADALGVVLSAYPVHLTPPTEQAEIRTLDRAELAIVAPTVPPTASAFYRSPGPDGINRIFLIGDQRGARIGSGGGRFRRICVHEWGHLVDVRLLTEALRVEWQSIWLRAWMNDELPSDYAAASAREGLAEAFAAVLAGSGVAQEQADFVRRILDDPSLTGPTRGARADDIAGDIVCTFPEAVEAVREEKKQ